MSVNNIEIMTGLCRDNMKEIKRCFQMLLFVLAVSVFITSGFNI